MQIAFLIEIYCDIFSEKISYETIDKFIQLHDEDECLETKIMKKYPTLNCVDHCSDYIVFDQFTDKKYLIVSNYI